MSSHVTDEGTGTQKCLGYMLRVIINSKCQVLGLTARCARPQHFGPPSSNLRGGNFSLKNVSVEGITLLPQPFCTEEGILEGSLSHLITKLKAKGALLVLLFCLCSWCNPDKQDVS